MNIVYANYRVYILHMPFRRTYAQTQNPAPDLQSSTAPLF